MSLLRLVLVCGVLMAACQRDNPAFDEVETQHGTLADEGVGTQADEGMDSQADAGDGDGDTTGDGDGDTTGDGDGDTTGDGDGDTSSTDTSTTGDGDGDTTGDGDGDTGTTTTGDGDGDTTGDGDGDPIACGVFPVDNQMCQDCVADMCCLEVMGCLNDPLCACLVECVIGGIDLQTCQQQNCNDANNEQLNGLNATLSCVQDLCSEPCG